MQRNLMFLLIALVSGAMGGYVVKLSHDTTVDKDQQRQNATASRPQPISLNPFAVDKREPDQLQRMEQELAQLRTQVVHLQNRIDTLTPSSEQTNDEIPTETDAGNTSPATTERLTKDNLILAGVDEALAAEIIQRKSELEYRQLELRDRAIRENYFNSPRYFQQLRDLNAGSSELRDDIGSDAYDRYLYVTGQNNRVVVSSIMSGSPAEQAGLQKGDIILSYGNDKIFNWQEARQATTQGNRNEYVNVDILRDGQTLNLVFPRGPLGVRLDATRLNPDG